MNNQRAFSRFASIIPWLMGLFIVPLVSFAQTLPVIRANTKTVTIVDGTHLKKDYWYLMPERKPDSYYVEFPENAHQVSFITDQDSISFDVRFGQEYDFVILLNGQDSCYTRIRSVYRNKSSYKRLAVPSNPSTDTLEFSVGDNDKIYLQGLVNGAKVLNFQFDLGAMPQIVKKSSGVKAKMKFDASDVLTNSKGTHRMPASTGNTLKIGNLYWEKVRFTTADNLRGKDDGLLGNLFGDKVIEIIYDQKKMVIHDQLPVIGPGYIKHAMFLEYGIVPFIKADAVVDKVSYSDWFMYDTGHMGNAGVADWFVNKIGLGQAKKRKQGSHLTVDLPVLQVSGTRFENVPVFVDRAAPGTGHQKLGIKILKYYNVIIDNRGGFIYMQPNALMATRSK
ncbi:hypothetical protein [Spirosoma knui]